MKPFDDLQFLGKVRRFRRLAEVALGSYGLTGAHFRLVRVAGNVVFRVHAPKMTLFGTTKEQYEDGQYLLRIHDSLEQESDAIELEMRWLAALCRENRVPVPEPIPNMRGRLVTRCGVLGIPEMRDCTLLRWLKGRRIAQGIRPSHFRAQGRAMAQLHNHAAGWQPPKSLTKRRFDYDGLFNDDAGAGFPNRAVWPLLPDRHSQVYRVIAARVKRLINTCGKGPDVFGLIHGDCGVDANVLFWKGEAHIIDFDGSGFGYYMYDLALALEHCWKEKEYPQFRDALLSGYAEHRMVSNQELEQLNLFRAAFYVYMGLWTIAMDQTYPDSPNKAARHEKWLDYGTGFIQQYLDGR